MCRYLLACLHKRLKRVARLRLLDRPCVSLLSDQNVFELIRCWRGVMGAAHLCKVVPTFIHAIIFQVVLLHRCSLLPIIKRLMSRSKLGLP